ncbi:MAG: protein kinase domain-containing protein, partial [Gammaproteobacteria bacterium]
MELPIHAFKPAGTRRILIVSESQELRLLLAQLCAMEWPDAEIHEWDPRVPEGTAGAAGRADADVVLMDDALEGAGPGLIGVFPAGLTARPPIVRLLNGATPQSHGNAALVRPGLSLHKSDLSRAALGAVVRAALARGSGSSDAPWQSGDTVPIGAYGDTEAPEDAEAVRLNGFLMLRKLGSGGMSTIFLAQHVAKGIPMALKILDSKLIEDERFLDLFMREYNLISHIKSPHVVRIYEQGFTDTHVYIAMEYFSQGDLKDRLRYGALAPARALRIFC